MPIVLVLRLCAIRCCGCGVMSCHLVTFFFLFGRRIV